MQSEFGQPVRRASKLNKRTVVAFLMILIAIPATIVFGLTVLDDRRSLFISLAIIIETMIPFFMIFEHRRPEAREIIVIAVMTGIAVASRAAFFMVPQFSPVLAIVIIAGVCMGAEAGFFTGALTALVSNFFFGQGPWTPWQMFAMGIIGFLAGILVKKGILKKSKLSLCIFGGVTTMLIYGLLMDTCSLFTMGMDISQGQILTVYLLGIPFNIVLAVATVFFLFIMAKPMIEKLDRVKKKYGMLEP